MGQIYRNISVHGPNISKYISPRAKYIEIYQSMGQIYQNISVQGPNISKYISPRAKYIKIYQSKGQIYRNISVQGPNISKYISPWAKYIEIYQSMGQIYQNISVQGPNISKYISPWAKYIKTFRPNTKPETVVPHSILAVANLLAHNNKSQICYCGQISLQSAAVNCSFSDTFGVTFILLVMVHAQKFKHKKHIP